MGKKTSRPKTTQRKVTSVSALRASRAVDAVTPAFVEWCRQTEGAPAEDALVLLGPVKELVAAYFHASPSSEATNFEPTPFALAIAEVLGTYDDGQDDETEFAFDAIHVYIEFLGETDTWTGTEANYSAVDDLFHPDEEQAFPEVVAPNLTAEEELAGLESTALAQRMEALLRWIGSGKAVTTTGALRLKDIEEAAAAVGVAAKGAVANAKREDVPLFGLEAAPSDSARTVKSMHEVPLLAKIWIALASSGLIDIGSTKVWPTLRATEFLEEGHPSRREVLGGFITRYLAVAVLGEEEWAPWVVQAARAQATVLYAACAQASVPVDALTGPAALKGLGLDEFGVRLVRDRMNDLSELGLVTLEGIIAMPPAVVPAVMAVLGNMFPEESGHNDPWAVEEKPKTPKKSKGKARKSGPPAQILQLKVMLKGTKPPIWRRLLVRSDLTLEQLHHIIQAAFGWSGGHLHQFRVGGWGGVEYGPVGPEFDFGDPMPLDESSVDIGELLAAEKDALTYIYDFGDDWQHAVTVEKVLPYDGGAPAVRCTGGRGAAPVDDCGGVWGWQEMVTAANDPSHERHDEYREWLGLEPGEVFDAKAFDLDDVNDYLLELY